MPYNEGMMCKQGPTLPPQPYLRVSYVPKLGGPAYVERYIEVKMPVGAPLPTPAEWELLGAEVTAAVAAMVAKPKPVPAKAHTRRRVVSSFVEHLLTVGCPHGCHGPVCTFKQKLIAAARDFCG